MALDNATPNIYSKIEDRKVIDDEYNDDVIDVIDSREVFGESLT